MKLSVIALLSGAILGGLSSKILFVGSGLSLIPWTIAGLALGWYCHCFKQASKIGAVYGFTLSFIFMLTGYTSSPSVVTRLPFFAALGLFGAICGLILAIIGYLAKTKIRPSSNTPRITLP